MSENIKPMGAIKDVPDRDLASITSSPHVRDKMTTAHLMLLVIIALIPTTVFGIINFGIRALMLIAICVIACVLSEYCFQKLMKKTVTITDYSAALTGLLLALNLPVSATWWMAVIGSVFAIIIVKQAYGGIGHNFMNPALGARCFLLISFTARMTNFAYDTFSGPTPLAVLNGKAEDITPDMMPTLKSMFVGNIAGTIGETSVIMLLIGGIFLIAVRVIDFRIPLFYLGTFTILTAIYALTNNKDFVYYVVGNLCGGGIMLGAFFMATDYVSSPITRKGKIIYGIILGLITFILRSFGPAAEGVSYAIIISNLLVPLIERYTIPLAFGLKKERRSK